MLSKIPATDSGEKRPVLKGTWSFEVKRTTGVSVAKFKTRYCVCGDLQKEGITYFDAYAPFVQ